jgi:hypothetical protein
MNREQIELIPGCPRIGNSEDDVNVFFGFDRLASQQRFRKMPLPNGIYGRCS